MDRLRRAAIVSALTDALRESKMLARSQRRSRRSARPPWRGALLASVWVVIVLGLSAGAEIPLLLSKFQNVSGAEEIMKVWQSLNAAKAADPMLIASVVASSAVRSLLRPVLGIAFGAWRLSVARTETPPGNEIQVLDRSTSVPLTTLCSASVAKAEVVASHIAMDDRVTGHQCAIARIQQRR